MSLVIDKRKPNRFSLQVSAETFDHFVDELRVLHFVTVEQIEDQSVDNKLMRVLRTAKRPSDRALFVHGILIDAPVQSPEPVKEETPSVQAEIAAVKAKHPKKKKMDAD